MLTTPAAAVPIVTRRAGEHKLRGPPDKAAFGIFMRLLQLIYTFLGFFVVSFISSNWAMNHWAQQPTTRQQTGLQVGVPLR